MDLSFVRGDELSRRQRTMSAELYNKIHLLFARSKGDHLLVPIRPMQYLAIIDSEEIVFVDGLVPRAIEISWQSFRPQERENLHDSVNYQCVIYAVKAEQTLQRLSGELFAALQLLESRQSSPPVDSVVTPFDRGNKK